MLHTLAIEILFFITLIALALTFPHINTDTNNIQKGKKED